MANPRPPPTKYQPPNKAYFLPVEDAERGTKAGKPRKKRGRAGRALGTAALALLLLVIVGLVAIVLLLPGCIKQQCIAAAAGRGVTLEIQDVRLGPQRFTLVGVAATAADVPGVRVTSPEVDVQTSIFDPELVTVKNAEVTADASFDQTKVGLAKWRATHLAPSADGTTRTTPFPKLVVDGAHLVWEKPFGEGKIEALAVHVEITDRGGYDEVHVMAPRVTLASPALDVGPWRADYDRDATTARVRVAFDPQVPDGANALFVGDGETVTSLDVNVPRSPLAHLGVSPKALGLPDSESTQLEAKIQYRHGTPALAETRATATLYGIKLGKLPLALDASLDAYAVGDPRSALDVKKGDLSLGPLKGAVTGTEKVFDGGFRLDLAWKAGPVACTAFLTVPSPPGAPPDPVNDLRQQIGQFAAATGLAKVAGEIEVDARLVLDTRDLGQTQVSISEPKACEL